MPTDPERRLNIQLSKEDHAKLIAKYPGEEPREAAKRLLLENIRGETTDYTAKAKKLDSETKRLKNLKLCLDIWNGLKTAGFSLEQATEVMRGEKVIPTPELPFTKPAKSDSDICGFCGHEHVKSEPRVCKTTSCLCGLR